MLSLRRNEIGSILFLALATLVPACGKGDAPAVASASPGAPPPPPQAKAETTPAGPGCPQPLVPLHKDGKGAGTITNPCKATGAARMIELTWTGKTGRQPEFKVKNVSGKPIVNMSTYIYLYDKDGKVLKVKNSEVAGAFAGNYDLGANETKTKEMGPEKADIPAEAVTIEGEAVLVGFSGGPFWTNMDIAPGSGRPKGGLK